MQPEIDLFGLAIKTFGLAFGLSFVLLCGALLARRLQELGKPVDWAYEIIFAGLVGGLSARALWYVADNLDELSDDFLGDAVRRLGARPGTAVRSAAPRRCCAWACAQATCQRRRCWTCARRALALGYAGGRVGCQVSGDGDYGKPWDGPWAMAYPDGVVPTDEKVHPTPIYETLAMG